eukprot:TRINITY_DN36310_c0_g1_i1.p1 TRINITY_DN36310_c0_g1~~TRINITY_DN36310_c0_g1_i1.p1  ORF type:complete len:2815 (+),score=683.22 TRINITY_DN36310_c0_g1_i1:95-8446(+)
MDKMQEKMADHSRQARQKGLKIPILNDFIAGNMRSRETAVLAFTFMISSCILTLCFHAFRLSTTTGLEVTFETTPPQSAFTAIPMENFTVRIRSKSDNAPVSDVTVNVFAFSTQLFPIKVAVGDEGRTVKVRDVDCAKLLSEAPTGFTHIDRDLCAVNLTGNFGATNAEGIAVFEELTVVSGPPGSVQLIFTVAGAKEYGTHVMRLQTPVQASSPDIQLRLPTGTTFKQWLASKLKKTCDPTATQVCWNGLTLGQASLPLRVAWLLRWDESVYSTVQRRVLASGGTGFPKFDPGPGPQMSDSFAVVMALPISQAHSATQGIGLVADQTDGKTAYFRNAVQQAVPKILPADGDFDGTRCPYCPIMEAQFDLQVESWDAAVQFIGFQLSSSAGMLDLWSNSFDAVWRPKSVLKEVGLVPEIASVEVLGKPDNSSYVEGAELLPLARFRLLDSAGRPIRGKRLFARVTLVAGEIRPRAALRDNKTELAPKRLEYPVSSESGDDGIVNFTNLAFTVGGPVGRYAVSIGAEGSYVGCPSNPRRWGDYRCPLWEGGVTSKISDARAFWGRKPASVQLGVAWSSTPLVLVADADGNAIAGKSLELVVTADQGEVAVAYEGNPSGSDGWVSLRSVNVTYYSGGRNTTYAELTVELYVDGVMRESYSVGLDMGTVPTYLPPAPPVPVYPCRIEEECGPLFYSKCMENALKFNDPDDKTEQQCRCEGMRTMCEVRTAMAADVGMPGIGEDDPQPGCAYQSIFSECSKRVAALGCDNPADGGWYCEAAKVQEAEYDIFKNCDPLVMHACNDGFNNCIERGLVHVVAEPQDFGAFTGSYCSCTRTLLQCAGDWADAGASCLGPRMHKELCQIEKQVDELIDLYKSWNLSTVTPWQKCAIDECAGKRGNSSGQGGTPSRRARVLAELVSSGGAAALRAAAQQVRRPARPLQQTGSTSLRSETGCAHVIIEDYPTELHVGWRFARPFRARAVDAFGDPLRGVPLRLEVGANRATGEIGLLSLSEDVFCKDLTRQSRCSAASACLWYTIGLGCASGQPCFNVSFCEDGVTPGPAGSKPAVGPVVTDEWGRAVFRRYTLAAATGDSTVHFVVRAGKADDWGVYACSSDPVAVRIRERVDMVTIGMVKPADGLVLIETTNASGAPVSGVRVYPTLMQQQEEVAWFHPFALQPISLRPIETDASGHGRCLEQGLSDGCYMRLLGSPQLHYDQNGDLDLNSLKVQLWSAYPGIRSIGAWAEGHLAVGTYPEGPTLPSGEPPSDHVVRIEVDESDAAKPGCHHIAVDSVQCAQAKCLWDADNRQCHLPQGRPFPRAPRARAIGPDGKGAAGVVLYAGIAVLPEALITIGDPAAGQTLNVSTVELNRPTAEDDPGSGIGAFLDMIRKRTGRSGGDVGLLLDPEVSEDFLYVAAVERIITPARAKNYFTNPVAMDYKADRRKRFIASDPTDSQGWATFTDLGLVGAWPGVYQLVFSFLRESENDATPVSARSQYLLYVSPPGLTVSIAQQPSALTSPGIPLMAPPVIQVKDPHQTEDLTTIRCLTRVFDGGNDEESDTSAKASVSGEYNSMTASAVGGSLALKGLSFTDRSLPGSYVLRISVPGGMTRATNRIVITESAGTVEALENPNTVSVGASWVVRVFVGIANRAALPEVQVTAGLRGPDEKNCVSDACGVLDASSAQGITGADGIATLRLRILAAEPGEYTLKLTAGAGVSSAMRTARGDASVVIVATRDLGPAVTKTVMGLVASPQSVEALSAAATAAASISAAASSGGVAGLLSSAEQGMQTLQGLKASFSSEVASFSMLQDMSNKLINLVSGGAGKAVTQSVDVQLTVTNIVANVSIVTQPSLGGTPSLSTSGPARSLAVFPKIRVSSSDGEPLSGKSVRAVALPEDQKATLQYNLLLTTDAQGEVTLQPFSFASGEAGKYQLVFLCDGVTSAKSVELEFTKPKSVSATERLKDRLLLMLLFMLPLFRANYTKAHPAWAVLGLVSLGGYFIYFYFEYHTDLDHTVFNNPEGTNQYIVAFLIVTLTLGVVLILSVGYVLFVALVGHKSRQGPFSADRAEGAIEYARWLTNLRVPPLDRGRKPEVIGIVQRIKGQKPAPLPTDAPPHIRHMWFPVRFIVAIMAVTVTIGIAMGLLWHHRDTLVYYTDKLGNSVPEPNAKNAKEKDAFNEKLRDGISTTFTVLSTYGSVFKSLETFKPRAQEIDYYALWENAYTWTRGAASAIRDSAIAATCLALFMMLVQMGMLLLVTKGNMLAIRRGQAPSQSWLRTKVSFTHAEWFIGLQVLLFTLGFFLTWFLVYIVFLIVLWQPLRDFVLGKVWAILLGMLGVTLAKMLFEMIVVNKIWSNGITMYHPRLFLLWALPMLFVNFVSGAMQSLTRCGMAIGMICMWFPRTDLCMFPELRNLDKGWMSYWAMLFTDNEVNNPTGKVFAALLIVGYRQAERAAGRPVVTSRKDYAGETDLPSQIGLIAERLDPVPFGRGLKPHISALRDTDIEMDQKPPAVTHAVAKRRVRHRLWLWWKLTANPSLRADRKFRLQDPPERLATEGAAARPPRQWEGAPRDGAMDMSASSLGPGVRVTFNDGSTVQGSPGPSPFTGAAVHTPRGSYSGAAAPTPHGSYSVPGRRTPPSAGSPLTPGQLGDSRRSPGAAERLHFSHFAAVEAGGSAPRRRAQPSPAALTQTAGGRVSPPHTRSRNSSAGLSSHHGSTYSTAHTESAAPRPQPLQHQMQGQTPPPQAVAASVAAHARRAAAAQAAQERRLGSSVSPSRGDSPRHQDPKTFHW